MSVSQGCKLMKNLCDDLTKHTAEGRSDVLLSFNGVSPNGGEVCPQA